jgi:hypothetical protein
MPVHDWARVDAGTFHGFHTAWLTHLSEALNDGRLPAGYYSLPEQHGGRLIADVLTLHASPPAGHPLPTPTSGGVALADAPPKVRQRRTVNTAATSRRRTLAIHHVTGHRIVALVEIVSPGNKDRPSHVKDFVAKVTTALAHGVHVTLADLFRPGPHDPEGIDAAVWRTLDDSGEPYGLPLDAPLTLAAYRADSPLDVYFEHLAFGRPLPEVPLFLTPDYYINLPLESTYESAFRRMPEFWREFLQSPPPI